MVIQNLDEVEWKSQNQYTTWSLVSPARILCVTYFQTKIWIFFCKDQKYSHMCRCMHTLDSPLILPLDHHWVETICSQVVVLDNSDKYLTACYRTRPSMHGWWANDGQTAEIRKSLKKTESLNLSARGVPPGIFPKRLDHKDDIHLNRCGTTKNTVTGRHQDRFQGQLVINYKSMPILLLFGLCLTMGRIMYRIYTSCGRSHWMTWLEIGNLTKWQLYNMMVALSSSSSSSSLWWWQWKTRSEGCGEPGVGHVRGFLRGWRGLSWLLASLWSSVIVV